MKDWIKRTIKTFMQVFGGIVFADLAVLISGDLESIKSLIIAAASAGICAVWNYVLEHMEEKNGE